ncbi:MAG: aminotransferase class III-fold pyridoxal phosphate-dependent enzyme, partial [Verrucomicrobiae bacterium]|nr:aminotransferase class III-fold pyridoxal phosphate-dependent enzyme [Verrucomicrobiae bacterium]
RLMGGTGKMFFCNSGAEANECLFKLARLAANNGLPPSAPRKFEIITTLNSFHGRTMAGIAATGQEKVKKGFDPLTPGFVHVPYNDLEAARRAVTPHTAAILIEGMQGEGGIFPATPEYLLGLRELCDRNGILLMIDAVQCGMGRTGSFMSYDRILEGNARASTFKPDAVSMAKSLGNGYPIGAAWIAPQWQDLFQPGTHGTTYGGTPLACAVSLAVLETIQRENLLQNVRSLGDYLKTSLQAMAGASKIREVRGEGLILGIELTEEAKPTVSALLAAGLVVIPSGAYCFRLLPPYNITRAEAEEALALIRKVCGP